MRGLGAEDAAALRRTGEDGDPGAIRTRVRSQIEDLTVFVLLLLAASSSSAAPPQLLLRSWLLRTAALRRTGEDGDPGAIRTRVRSQIEDLTVFVLLLLAASSSSAAPPQLLLRSWLLRTAALRRTGED